MTKKIKSAIYVAAVLALAVCRQVAQASGPISVYARIDKVEFEPNAEQPDRIRITGVFVAATDNAGQSYSAPEPGYIYFALPASDQKTNAMKEWSDLKAVAGTRQIIGLGSAWFSRVQVRRAEDKAASPETYPLGNGLIRVNPDQPRALALLSYNNK